MKLKIGVFVLIAIAGLIAMSCSSIGSAPSGKAKMKFYNSKNYDSEKQEFRNRIPGLIEEVNKRFKFKDMFTFFKERKDAKPSSPLPEVKPDLKEFLAPSDDLKSIWFGHSTFLLNMNGTIILVDPVFSKSASPVSFMVPRFQKPVLELNELPNVDYVLISHDHYDHLDMESVKFFRNKDTEFLVPLGVGSHLKGWGIKKENIFEKDWWENYSAKGGVEFIATPAQHFSGRGLMDRNKTLWASWVIRTDKHNVYFSGDSGYDTHFKEIGDKYGPFDVAFLETGQYNKKWREVHMLPEEGVIAYADLKAKRYFPVHWGMFILSYHTWYEPMEELYRHAEGKNVDILIPKFGEIVNYSANYENSDWWRKR